MKYRNIFISSLIALVSLTGCIKENFDGSSYADEEGAIRFATSSSVDVKTKTVYGEYNSANNSWPIYWTTSDIVKVYCPQAQGDAKSEKIADYKVLNATGNSSIHSELKLANNTQALKWGESEAHEFYTFYPASRVYLTGDDGTFTVSVPREQNAVVTNTESNGVTTYRAVDMNAAVMTGYKSVNKSSIGENGSVELPFKPITTAFDIVIGAPVSVTGVTNAIKSTWITSITIANKAETTSGRTPLAGGFTYNAKTGADSYKLYTNTTTSEDAQSYTVNIIFDKPVELKAGASDKLIVTAFLLPETLPDIRVIVNCRENTTSGAMSAKTATVKMSTKEASTYKGKKNTINLGNLPNPIIFSYETWMANLPDNTYVSQMSLPGTHDAGAYSSGSLTQAFAQTQTLTISQQFDNGIRVLDFRPSYDSSVSGNFDISHGYISTGVLFDDVMNQAITWLAKHPTEFIIIELKNESTGDSNFVNWQKSIREKLTSINEDYVIYEFFPDMTLKDGRGKILFMSRDDYYPSKTETSAFGSWVGCKISGWPDNNSSWSRTFYTSPNHENSEAGGIGTIWVSDRYSARVGNISESNKKSDIKNMLNNAASNTEVDVWYMTWLNVSGTFSIFNPGRETKVYNEYAYNIISGYSDSSYTKTGIVMMDWAGYSEYEGVNIIKSIIDNNFKGSGPAKKTN